MKKQLLCTLAFCSAFGTAQAQTEVTGDYLANPSFEILKTADGSADVTAGAVDGKLTLPDGLYGWEVVSMSDYGVESAETGSVTGFPASGTRTIYPTEGTYYYFNRQGWGNKDSELKTTTTAELPAGTYYAVIDYKAADYSNNNTDRNGTAIGLRVTDAASNVLGENPATRRAHSLVAGGSNPGTDSYMVDAGWEQMGTVFTVAEPAAVTLSIVQNMKNSGDRRLRFERDRLYNKVKQLEADIALLENNIGFFSKSKNAEAMIRDVKDKIERAKEEMAAAIDKINLIDKQESGTYKLCR